MGILDNRLTEQDREDLLWYMRAKVKVWERGAARTGQLWDREGSTAALVDAGLRMALGCSLADMRACEITEVRGMAQAVLAGE